MKAARGLLIVAGVAAGLWGLKLLLDSPDTIIDVAVWAIAGVVLHDGLWAPIAFAIGAWGVSRLDGPLRAPLMTGMWVSATVTLIAIPVLGSFGARPDNPSLLDRNYWAGWLAVLGIVWLAVAIWALRVRRKPAAA